VNIVFSKNSAILKLLTVEYGTKQSFTHIQYSTINFSLHINCGAMSSKFTIKLFQPLKERHGVDDIICRESDQEHACMQMDNTLNTYCELEIRLKKSGAREVGWQGNCPPIDND